MTVQFIIKCTAACMCLAVEVQVHARQYVNTRDGDMGIYTERYDRCMPVTGALCQSPLSVICFSFLRRYRQHHPRHHHHVTCPTASLKTYSLRSRRLYSL